MRLNTEKILDVEVLFLFCQGCSSWKDGKTGDDYNMWLEKHKEICTRNHYGPAGNIMVEGLNNLFCPKHSLSITVMKEMVSQQYVNHVPDVTIV